MRKSLSLFSPDEKTQVRLSVNLTPADIAQLVRLYQQCEFDRLVELWSTPKYRAVLPNEMLEQYRAIAGLDRS